MNSKAECIADMERAETGNFVTSNGKPNGVKSDSPAGSGWIKEPGVDDPPLRSPATKPTLKGEIQQGWGYVMFVWNLSKRIRSWRNRLRFILGLILWKPILPDDR